MGKIDEIRTDIKEQCLRRLDVLKEFAPEEMSEDAIRVTSQGNAFGTWN